MSKRDLDWRPTRRELLRSAAAASVLAGAGLAGCATGAGPHAEEPRGPFRHGVASGDPLADRVVLWTRVTPATPADTVQVGWRVALDPALQQIVASGTTATGSERDYTVKVDAAGLDPGRTWYYRFDALGDASPTGRTRTLPDGPLDRLRLATCACANYPSGYFNAYAAIARRPDLDAVVHLGDYIYEYGNSGYGAGHLGRVVEPGHELVSLDDYRTRYAQYRGDPDLQALHRQHPMIPVWDDHEFSNDAWHGGAPGHDPAVLGAWAARRAAATRAWREWMPVRVADEAAFDVEPRTWRAFRFGDLAELAMLDTRLAGRDKQAPRTDRYLIEAPGRELLGAEQEQWLFATLEDSTAAGVAWRLLGQQVVLAPWARPPRPPSPDGWDGYPEARDRFLDRLEAERIRDVVVLTGDVHSSWALEVARDPFSRRGGYDPRSGAGALAVEFVTPAVSSTPLAALPGALERFGDSLAELPHLRFMELVHRGYVLLDVDRERAQAEWWFVDTVEERNAAENFARAFATRHGTSHLEAVAAPSAPRADASPLAPET